MALIKWNPQSNFPSSFSSYVDSFFNDEFFKTPSVFTEPSVNIVESEDGYRLEVAAPGFEKSEFNVDVEHNVLTISAEKKNEQKEEKENYTRREFSYASFKRSFTLPETIESDSISAGYEKGILNISLPKKKAAKEETRKRISVS